MTTTCNDIPITCNLSVFTTAELESHVDLALDVLFRWPKHTRELPDGFLFEYEGSESRFLDLARFAYGEHRCCSWESFALEMDPFPAGGTGQIRLRYGAGVEGKPILAAALQRFEQAALDPDARQRLLSALRGRDSITVANQDALYSELCATPGQARPDRWRSAGSSR
jgi:hypothetical protein